MWNDRLKRIEKALEGEDDKNRVIMFVRESDMCFDSEEEEREYIREKSRGCPYIEITAESVEQWRDERSKKLS